MSRDISRHESYHNRFRTPASGGNHSAAEDSHYNNLSSVSGAVDIFGHSPNFGHLSFSPTTTTPPHSNQNEFNRMHSVETGAHSSGLDSGQRDLTGPRDLPRQQSQEQPSRPTQPGKPRRLSRQTSAESRRQQFAATKTLSGEAGHRQNVTSADSGCDDVFVEVGDNGEYDAISGRPIHTQLKGKKSAEPTFSTSSTASILPNPYNQFNHRLHDFIWCCNCIYFVFFCCLPAIHYMEQSDTEYNKGNHRRARTLARWATFLFCTGTVAMLSVFALIFFFAIFFTVYN